MTSTAVRTATQRLAMESLLEVDGLRIERVNGHSTNTVVSSVSMAVAAGETIGIVGESGSGKSMTARAMIGLLPPGLRAHGEIRYEGRNLLALKERQWQAVRGREIGLVMQDPFTMLSPVMRVGRALTESVPGGRRLGRRARREDAIRRLAEVGIEDETVADKYPFQLSGGMRQRVGIAAALAGDPNLLIADEPSTALDATTQQRILALIKGIQRARGMALVLITHDLRVAFAMCDRIYVLYAGSLVEVGAARAIEAEPLHPYTHGLLLSEPPVDGGARDLVTIPGSVPRPDQVADSCVFAPRCRWASDDCRRGAPPLLRVAEERESACVRLPEIRAEMRGQRANDGVDEAVATDRASGALVTVRDVRKVFHQAGRAMTALDGVSIDVGENESVAIVGESGSGKTTLARILVGLETATSGDVTVAGIAARDWSTLGSRESGRLRGTIQTVFQDPYSSLNPMWSIGRTLAEAITTHHSREPNVRGQVADLLRLVGLPEGYAARKPVALSGGERQRVAIARALAPRPKVLVCDEPVSALDASVQAQVLNLLGKLKAERGLSYLFITHDLSIARHIAEFVYVMHNGRVVESGPTRTVLTEPRHDYTRRLLAALPGSRSDWPG